MTKLPSRAEWKRRQRPLDIELMDQYEEYLELTAEQGLHTVAGGAGQTVWTPAPKTWLKWPYLNEDGQIAYEWQTIPDYLES